MMRAGGMLMKVRIIAAVLLVIAAAAVLPAVQASTADLAFEAARKKEVVDRDLTGAIALYRQVVSQYAANRVVASKALLRLGECYEQMDIAEAIAAYERLLRNYPDSEAAPVARTRLNTLAQRSGLSATQVWSGRDVDSFGSVSPDGRYLTFTEWNTNDLAWRDLKSGATRNITANSLTNPEWPEYSVPSTDGKFVAYAWHSKASVYELRVVARDGKTPQTLFAAERRMYIRPYAWSRDSKEILFSTNMGDGPAEKTKLHIVSVAGGQPRLVKEVQGGIGDAAWSADGRFIAFDAQSQPDKDDHDIFLVSSDGASVSTLVSGPSNEQVADWFLDGRRLLFVSDRSGTNSLFAQNLVDGRADGEPALIKADVGNFHGQGFTRDGAYYYSVSTRTDDVVIARLSAAGTVAGRLEPLPTRFAGGKQQASFSPDGSQLAFVQMPLTPGGRAALAIQTLASGEIRTIPVSLGSFANPAWTRDGKALLVQGEPTTGGQGLFSIAADTGVVTPIKNTVAPEAGTARQLRRYPSSSANGREVFYTLGGGMAGIHASDLASGSTREITAEPARSFAVSPDGQFIAFTPQGQKQTPPVSIVPVGGGPVRALATELEQANLDSGIAWTPDGKYVLFARADPQGLALWRVPVAGGAAQKTGIVVRGRLLRVSVHPDGRIALSTLRSSEEIWMMRNLPPAAK